MPQPIFVLNGPNLNALGTRETAIYGTETLAALEARCREAAGRAGYDLSFRQSNHEGVLVDWIQEARGGASALVINAAGYSHTSVAIHDALKLLDIPIIEVHLSNIYTREPFRHHSHVSRVAQGVIAGLGPMGYALAITAAAALIASKGAQT